MESGFHFNHFPPIPKNTLPNSLTLSPFRTVACQSLADDFYSNLIDWSGDKIFYCENNTVFQYNFHTDSYIKVFEDSSINVCSLKCMKQSDTLVIGCSSGILICLDLGSLKSTRHMFHRGRISAIEIIENRVLTGSRDRKVKMIDFRSKSPEKSYSFHMQEVCGISVNNDKRFVGTGGNDNKIIVLDFRKDDTYYKKLEEHKAAVKALSWSPLYSTKFISGGGTADKTLKQWDINLETSLQQSMCFESQICNVKWLENDKILSTFGYSNDDIKLLNDFQVEKVFLGHKNRVIHFAVDDKEEFFVSGSGDSNINIWKIDEKEREIIVR
ncbi:uncharacterized protein VICG_01932 [Vittaforma corneae ATCC 50505]|uniref:CDC20/Fizzy WD40 domain-containing protein n=1 Tax=Vittaforma corneae (strain ATCC 50505) TaxID=993615 RepID=L2GKL9_VITCO|nr:uncharacterized protein VICG_01932 [Vittaforma corneae ATCC 50505]ELA41050.1 hypothetical protein VICG_01932 [Vittaforma corneae ATCC 50505]